VYGTGQVGSVVGMWLEPLKSAFFLRYLGASAKLRQGTIGVVMSVCVFVCPSAWNLCITGNFTGSGGEGGGDHLPTLLNLTVVQHL